MSRADRIVERARWREASRWRAGSRVRMSWREWRRRRRLVRAGRVGEWRPTRRARAVWRGAVALGLALAAC